MCILIPKSYSYFFWQKPLWQSIPLTKSSLIFWLISEFYSTSIWLFPPLIINWIKTTTTCIHKQTLLSVAVYLGNPVTTDRSISIGLSTRTVLEINYVSFSVLRCSACTVTYLFSIVFVWLKWFSKVNDRTDFQYLSITL